MKIVVNDIAASIGGAMTVLRDFYTFICENDRENEWIFLLNQRYFEETENVKIITLPKVKKSGLHKLWFDFVSGRRYIRKLKPDVILSLQNIITFGLKVPQAVYIHQSIPFQEVKKFSFLRGAERKLAVIQRLIGRIIKWSAKKSNLVIVQTKWMKDAVSRMCHIPEDRVLLNMPKVNVGVAQEGTLDNTTFFYPTAGAVYKNNDCLYRASRLLRAQGTEHTVYMTLSPEKSEGDIICTGRLLHEDVLRWYRTSVLVFPSYIETVGLPLLEARAAGAVILAAETVFAREVLAGYENAYFFDPFQPEELAGLMKKVICGEIECRPNEQVAVPAGNSWYDVVKSIVRMGK